MSKTTKLSRPLEKHVQAACVAVLEARGCRVFRRNVGVMTAEHKGRRRVFRAGEKGAADRESLWFAVSRLGKQASLIMLMYYRLDMPMRDIGEHLGVSESRVSQMRSEILTRLRSNPRVAEAAIGGRA